MVKSARKAKEAYREGIKDLEKAYQEASGVNTPKKAAEILQKAAKKGEFLTTSDMVENYENAYE